MSHELRIISEEEFENILKLKLGDSYQRSLRIFKNYGDTLSYDVTNVLLHACDKNKLGEVLEILEKHWQEELQYQHPEVRGTVQKMGVNPTQQTFLRICKVVLQLQPNP